MNQIDQNPHKKHRKKPVRKDAKNNRLHLIFFLVVAVLFIITVVRLIVWNVGKRSGYDPDETTTEFDVELLDYVHYLDPAVLKDREDDGVTTILALGNDPFSDDRSEDGLAALMEKETDSTILNCAFPGSTIAMKNAEYDESYPLDGLSLYWITAALCNQNFELMEHVVASMDSESAAQALETLKSVDLEKVDDLIILYDLQDYSNGRIVYDENNLKNLITVYGALNASISLIQENYPHIRIFVLSQPYGTFTKEDGTVVDADMDDLGNGVLPDYINWELEVCRLGGASFVDNYYGAVTMDDLDCLTDGFHLNAKGRERVAKRFAEVFSLGK